MSRALLLHPPTREAALARLGKVRPAAYARTRNALEGAVTGLSPYITHGMLTLSEVLAGVLSQHPLEVQHKLVFELGWRAFFRHVWQQHGEGILSSLHEGVLPDHAYANILPEDIRQARTGVPVIDQAVRTLYDTGTLHNHARMWLASYVVHLRKVHWRVGADWLCAHLLDGDLASNHLSWQWVAATGSHKPYLFNAENVARFAPPAWHSPGSLLDTDYAQLDRMARSAAPQEPHPHPRQTSALSHLEADVTPALHHQPPLGLALRPPSPTEAGALMGRDVWLVHPWCLRAPAADLPANAVCIGVFPQGFFTRWAWSPARWSFVHQAMSALCERCWLADADALAMALSGARSVQTWAEPHADAHWPACVQKRAPVELFPHVAQPCRSFSQWWTRSTRGMASAHDLPGVQGLARTTGSSGEPVDPQQDHIQTGFNWHRP